MEFLLQLMAELFDTESEQQGIEVVAETSRNETVNCMIQMDEFEPELEELEEGNLIFDVIRFH